jgi:hypothetical protein
MACAEGLEQAMVLASWLQASESLGLTHDDVERRVETQGREVLRLLLQGHLDERRRCEGRVAGVVDGDAVARRRVERDHGRLLGTVFGQVTVSRLAYRAPKARNLYPADAVLNLPAGLHSYELCRRVVEQAVRGSFAATVEGVERATGVRVGKRQAQLAVVAAAVDVVEFYGQREREPVGAADLLVLTEDGKGVVMLPEALRERTRRRAVATPLKMLTRLAPGEKKGRKRMAQVGGVYDCRAVPRLPEQVITVPGRSPARVAGPTAKGKWLTASIACGMPAAVAALFDEAHRRDPRQERVWVVLVDGARAQIEEITETAFRRERPITIVIDFVHVLQYLWKAAHAFHADADPRAEIWVAEHAQQILAGRSAQVVAAIRAQAHDCDLSAAKRKLVDTATGYLTNNALYLGYATALDAGWPIATGVIEGACRHLVKDRMDITGARWGLAGAEAVLSLRAVVANGDLDDYWTYHLQQQHHRLHKSRYLGDAPPARSSH